MFAEVSDGLRTEIRTDSTKERGYWGARVRTGDAASKVPSVAHYTTPQGVAPLKLSNSTFAIYTPAAAHA